MSENWDRRGSALWIVGNALQNLFNVELSTYNGQKNGTLLAYDVLPENIPNSIKKILLIGGFKLKENGIPRNNKWESIDHVIFNSEFYKRIVLSKYNIKNNSVIYILGGAPSDIDMFSPINKTAKTVNSNNEINFVVCAKWWKRPFKRLKQSVHLFNNFILNKYPYSKLHVLGNNIKEDKQNNNIYYYRKTFHRDVVPKVFSKSHIQLILTPFDSGPLTLTESLHYRVPFVSSTNCCGPEIIKIINGKCGECVKIDSSIKTYKDCLKIKPITNKTHYDKPLDYQLIMEAIVKIVDNYEEYINWCWTDDFSYESQYRKIFNLI